MRSRLCLLSLLVGCTTPEFLDDGGADGAVDSALPDGAQDAEPPLCTDPACPLFYSTPHLPIELHRSATAAMTASSHYAPELSGDGTALYFTRVDDVDDAGELYVARRTYGVEEADAYGPFRTPEVVAFSTPRPIRRATLTADGVQVFVEAPVDPADPTSPSSVFTASRTSGSFGTLVEVPALAGMRARRPTVSRDGAELIVQIDNGLFSLRRTSDGASFSPPVPIEPLGENPRLSEDGRTLTFSRDTTLYELTRDATTDDFEGDAELSRFNSFIGDTGYLPILHAGARELWYTLFWPRYPESSGLGAGLMRARVCEAEPCALLEDDGCQAGEIATPDGLSCFSLVSPGELGMDWSSAAASACPPGTVAASIHTPDETVAVLALMEDSDRQERAYIGLRRDRSTSRWSWQTGEPYWGNRFTRTVDEFDDSASIRASDGGWLPSPGSEMTPGVCERMIWPTWSAPGP